MRDFTNGGDITAGGDININDNSKNDHKWYVNCSSEELIEDRPFRQENIKLEQERKVKRFTPFYWLSAFLFICAAVWAVVEGKQNLVSIVMGAGSFFVGYMSIKLTIAPNSFQVEEKNAVDEINKILRQRRVE